MKASTVPIICGLALTTMTTAGLSHWWSVRQFIATVNSGIAVQPTLLTAWQAPAAPTQVTLTTADQRTPKPTPQTNAPTTGQKEFYEALIAKMDGLQTQNRDLLDQLAETNRDLMKLEFRVDTHSESFRPLPVSEDRPFTSLSEDPGVLPPRAEPVKLPTYE